MMGALALLAGTLAGAPAQEANPQADNTKQNRRDRDRSQPTADRAKNNAADRDLMMKIRKAVVNDDSLSGSAHNVKIIARDGKVTLRGPVKNEAEKKQVEAKATEVAGAGNVTNELTVKGEKTKGGAGRS